MSQPVIGFIGFGEAGSTIAAGLRSAGVQSIFAYDIQTHAPDVGPRIQHRARETQATLVDSNAALAQACELLFSTVTSSSAVDAAKQTGPYLKARHFFADLNSVSPALKQTIADVIAASPARFVEAAVMAPVAPYKHQVPMLLGGPAAATFAETMRPFGMRLKVLAGPVGSAAAVKMCRSIVVKGLEALMVECVLGASRYHADDLVFDSLNESFPGIDWKKLALYMSGRVILHGDRRAREMEEVAETLRAIGIAPIMAQATARRQDSIARLNLRERFGDDGPANYEDLVDWLTSTADTKFSIG